MLCSLTYLPSTKISDLATHLILNLKVHSAQDTTCLLPKPNHMRDANPGLLRHSLEFYKKTLPMNINQAGIMFITIT